MNKLEAHYPVSEFLESNFCQFNARELLEAAKGYVRFVNRSDKSGNTAKKGSMMVSLAGAMSTAQIGKTLAPMIRNGQVHAISSTGANLEEDLFRLVGHSRYADARQWRYHSMEDDLALLRKGLNRVTDTCIPEDVMLELHEALLELWHSAAFSGHRYFHWEFVYQLIRRGWFDTRCDAPLSDSWVVAACEQNIPIYTPGAEDSTIGNMFCADVMQGRLPTHSVLKTGTEQFEHLTRWYHKQQHENDVGFFQIGGGIAGDFAMCVVPGLRQDHNVPCKHWRYFCHIGDATTSYGGYSGCPANEKISWDKLDTDTENYTINSDASIVAPLIFQYILEHTSQPLSQQRHHNPETAHA